MSGTVHSVRGPDDMVPAAGLPHRAHVVEHGRAETGGRIAPSPVMSTSDPAGLLNVVVPLNKMPPVWPQMTVPALLIVWFVIVR